MNPLSQSDSFGRGVGTLTCFAASALMACGACTGGLTKHASGAPATRPPAVGPATPSGGQLTLGYGEGPAGYGAGGLTTGPSAVTTALDSLTDVYVLPGQFGVPRMVPIFDRFVIAGVTVMQTSGSSMITGGQFSVTTPAGACYAPLGSVDALMSLKLAGMSPLAARTLRTGQRSHGYLLFDIPKGSAKISYQPCNSGGGGGGGWTIPPAE